MNNNYLLSLVSSAVPILAIAFVVVLLFYKFYIKIRSKFDAAVNCWFCNQNSRVPYLEANSWICAKCDQYNGFKNGDYNREIIQQRDCSNLSGTGANATAANRHSSSCHTGFGSAPLLCPPRNGFCDNCNESQRLKVEKLAQFEPKNESHFDRELKVYKAELEERFRLCSTCDRHLNKVLREKKKMVLGSKFLEFLKKGAESLKQPHFNEIRYIRQQWKRRCSWLITVFTILNIICLLKGLPALNRDAIVSILGESMGTPLFIICSHVLALIKVFSAYFQAVASHPTVVKAGLFCRTLFMLILYSMGLKWPQIVSFQLGSLYVFACPFVLLCCSFAYSVADGFKLTRYTFLLAVWSVFAGGLVEDKLILPNQLVLLITSFATLFLSAANKSAARSCKLNDDTKNSFHKIGADDYLDDEDTLSVISQYLNSSSSSLCSTRSNSSYRRFPSTAAASKRLTRSPLASSVASVNNLTSTWSRMQLSPNASLKSCNDECSSRSSLRARQVASVNCFSKAGNVSRLDRSSHFASNLESNKGRPQSAFGCSTVNVFNSSFLEGSSHSLGCPPRELDESHCNTCPVEGQQLNATPYFGAAPHNSPLLQNQAPICNAAYQQQRANSFLAPSRFNTICVAQNVPASASWLSGGYFNHRNPLNSTITQPDPKMSTNLLGHRKDADENLSRSSSQSSGFESQNSRPANASRETSLCPDANDLLQRTITTEQNGSVGGLGGFQPIEPISNNAASFSSLQSTPMRPLSVNCSSIHNGSTWLGSPATHSSSGFPFGGSLDSFNLRKINEDLPTIKRGDLLRKWQEGQALL